MRNPRTIQAHDNYVLGLQFSHDSQTLYSAGMDNLVHAWAAPTWERQRTFAGHTHSVNGISLSPQGNCILFFSVKTSLLGSEKSIFTSF